MSLEGWKAYNVMRLGARSLVKSKRPDLTDEEVEKVLDRLFEVCAEHREPSDLTACIYANLERVCGEVKRTQGGGGSSPYPTQEELPPAGVRLQFERLTVYLDRRPVEVAFTIRGRRITVPLIHDIFFFNKPEVSVHADVREVYCESGTLVIESYYHEKADRISVW